MNLRTWGALLIANIIALLVIAVWWYTVLQGSQGEVVDITRVSFSPAGEVSITFTLASRLSPTKTSKAATLVSFVTDDGDTPPAVQLLIEQRVKEVPHYDDDRSEASLVNAPRDLLEKYPDGFDYSGSGSLRLDAA